uniref:Uncharacterized protein n=1 Tax=Phakopsora pachyrhizi TaxID=170000 RepID=A0A0S1MJP2_PHAPC
MVLNFFTLSFFGLLCLSLCNSFWGDKNFIVFSWYSTFYFNT